MENKSTQTVNPEIDIEKIIEEDIQEEVTKVVLDAINKLITEGETADETLDLLCDETFDEKVSLNPNYGANINPYQSTWKISNPIALTARAWLGRNIDGINLSAGFYKIEYTLSGLEAFGSGLAIFEPETQKFRELITWHTFNSKHSHVIHIEGHKYIRIHSEALLSIVDSYGNFRPSEFSGVYIVTVLKLRDSTLP